MYENMDKIKPAMDQPLDQAVAWAETPAYLATIPAEVEIQETPLQDRLEADARAYLKANPDFMRAAKRLGHDIIAMDRRLIAGLGLAAVLGVSAGVIVIWQSRGKRRKE